MNTAFISLIQNSPIITNGLVGYWSLNDGNGSVALDFSGNRNNGSLSGTSPPTWTVGQMGNALKFSGATTTFVNIPDKANLRPGSGNYTIVYWFWAANAIQSNGVVCKRLNSAPFTQISTGMGNQTGGSSIATKQIYIFSYDARKLTSVWARPAG